MKVLEILKTLREAKTFTEYGVIFDKNSNNRLTEAIAEFEALENRNCNNCKKQETLMCPVTSFCGNIEDFSCNRWESKC